MSGLGWRPPEERGHERRYALAAAMPSVPCPVVMGVPWYEAFDHPERRGAAYWITEGDWGGVRGGHAVCLRPPSMMDVESAWRHYNQGTEGACTGFAAARSATLFNRQLYSGFMQYEAAQRNDEWLGEGYFGSSVNGALQGLRLEGAWPFRAGATRPARIEAGIGSFLWASTSREVIDALKSREGFVRILNSWGTGYPKEVRLSLAGLDRLMSEGGEFGVPVDRPGR